MRFVDYNDALRSHTSWRRFLADSFDGLQRGWLGDRYSRYGRESTAPSAVAFQHMIDDTVNADICWVSHEMMDLVQHAMVDFDATEPFTIEDAFIPHGFMVLPEPWRSIDVNDKIIAHRVYLWRLDLHGCVILGDDISDGEGTLQYTYDLNRAVDGVVEPTLRISTISHVDDEDDFSDHNPEILSRLRERGVNWGIAHTTTIPLRLVASARDVAGEGDKKAGWLTFWRVTQKLMAERIITSERRQAARQARRDAQRYGYDPAAPRVIELRRPTERDSDPEGDRLRDVNWTHRWINRGHWRQQPYPSLGVTKQIWISAYVKGPSDLPLIVRERVWKFDR
jgi:hypothetical protein